MSKHILTPRLNQLAASIALVAGGLALVPAAHAAAPAAGSNISNVATASYTDSFGSNKTATSNEVKTTVVQVTSFTLTASQSTTANPNGQVSLSHTLTNNGNGADSFKVDLANVTTGDDYDFTNIHVYLDADKDGNPDNSIDIKGTTINVGAGQSVGLIVVGTTSATASNTQTGQLTLTATNVLSATVAGGGNAATAKTNTDTVTIVAGAVIQVVKSVDFTTVNPNGELEYTLTYKNTGNDKATNVVISDDLSVADLANVTYKAGSAISSSFGALTDATDADAYVYNSTTKKLTFTIPEVAANSTATLKFKVTVNANASATAIKNTASFDPDGTGPQPAQDTNTVNTNIAPSYTGSINDSSLDDFKDGAAPTGPADPDSNKDDKLTAATSQGVPVNFGNNGGETIWIHNTGNIAETYNLIVNKSALPPGSIVELLKADGVSPLVDTNGDPTVDTGLIPVGGKYQIVVKVTLPPTFSGSTYNSGALDTIITAKPVNNPAVAAEDKVTLTISSVTANRVDLSNGAGNLNGTKDTGENAGEGPYVAADIIDTKPTNPATPVTFPLAVTNFGTVSDNYNISSNLPAGWDVKYFTATDATGNTCTSTQVTNTSNIGVGATAYLCAVVTPPAGATPSDSRPVVFTVSSPATGLSDSITDKININEVRKLVFTPDRTGQVAPGGTILYSHILTNNGNVTEGNSSSAITYAIAHAGNLGATTSVYIDVNNNGLADNNELVTDNAKLATLLGQVGSTSGNAAYISAGLQSGESVTILVKVEAPSSATAGQIDNSTVTFTPTAGIAVFVNDTTTVNVGQVRLVKEQAVDLDCNGVEDGGVTSYTQNAISAKPGQCVIYRITATNEGNAEVSEVVINDATPYYTTIALPAASNDSTVGTVTTPAVGATGTVSNNVTPNPTDKLAPAASARLKFGVKINPAP